MSERNKFSEWMELSEPRFITRADFMSRIGGGLDPQKPEDCEKFEAAMADIVKLGKDTGLMEITRLGEIIRVRGARWLAERSSNYDH